MPEGVGAYPRWKGELGAYPTFLVIAGQEVRRAWNSTWGRVAITLAFAYAVLYIGQIYSASQRPGGESIHTMETFLYLADVLRWAGLGLAAVMGGWALLEDERRGALELYLSRAVTRFDYLLGKVLAILGLVFLVVFGPALLYWGLAWAFFETNPEPWNWAPLGLAAYGLVWAVVVTGLGLGLASMSKSSRAASLLLFGGAMLLQLFGPGAQLGPVFIKGILLDLTKTQELAILGPFASHEQLQPLLFGVPPPHGFPEWWGMAAMLVLGVVGWALVAWKHPRLFRAVRD